MKKGYQIILVFVLLFVVDFAFGQGCSQCKALAEQSSEGGGSNINTGILILMIVPYILLFILFHKRIFSFFRELRGK